MLDKFNKPALWVALLGALKLILDSFGISLISDTQVNDIANGIAALVTVAGVIIDHGMQKPTE